MGNLVGGAMNILIVSFEDERWGVIRLVRSLEESGFAVAALCPPNDALKRWRRPPPR